MAQVTQVTEQLLLEVQSRCPPIADLFRLISEEHLGDLSSISERYLQAKDSEHQFAVSSAIQEGVGLALIYGVNIPSEWWNVTFELCYRSHEDLQSIKRFFMMYSPSAAPEISAEALMEWRAKGIETFLALRREIPAACKAQLEQGLVCMTVTTQPLPPIVVRTYALRDPHFDPPFEITVHPTDAKIIGPVDAYILQENFESHLLASMNSHGSHVITFPGLRIPGSFSARMNKSYILFVAFVQKADQLSIVATISNPFINITNISEAPAAQAKLIWSSFNVPDEQGNVSWESLVPYITSYFERTTAVNQMTRPLTHRDLSYLHSKVQNHFTLTWSEFRELWFWTSKVADTCHKRLGDRWLAKLDGYDACYLVNGFLSRADVEAYLANQEPGTFLIRFSDGKPQCFVASYVSPGLAVEHKLIDPKNFEGGRTLDDVITKDLSGYLRQLLTPVGVVDAIRVFRACTNIANKHGKEGYV